jgi:hypothetical protein
LRSSARCSKRITWREHGRVPLRNRHFAPPVKNRRARRLERARASWAFHSLNKRIANHRAGETRFAPAFETHGWRYRLEHQ